MSVLLLQIQTIERTELGIRLRPGLYNAQTVGVAEIQAMRQGSPIELRRPDGSNTRTTLETFGIRTRREGETLIYQGDFRDPEIFLFLPSDLADELLPAGTEVWLVG